jgi:hypothetical protein
MVPSFCMLGWSWLAYVCIGDVAADEAAPQLMCHVHYGKAASGGIDNEITRLRDGSDQPCDQTGRFRVRVDSAINLLSPPVRNTAITPSRSRTQRRLLQYPQVIAAPPGAVAHADAPAIPADHIDAWKDVGDVEMSTRADAVRVCPAHQVTARPQHPRYISAARVDIVITHRRQCTSRTLTGSLVAVFQPIEHAAVLWIEERGGRTVIWQ